MRVINLTYANNILQILPYAYYCVARMGGRRILRHKEGDIDWETKSKCLVGRDCLRLAVMNMSHSFLFNFCPSPRCRSPLCAYARGPYAEWHLLEFEDPLDPLRQYTTWHELHVCLECVTHCYSIPIYENTYLRILHRLQLIPHRHPKETRQFIPRLLHTNRMPRCLLNSRSDHETECFV